MGRFRHFFLAMVAVAGLMLGGCGDDDATIVVTPYNGKFLYTNTDSVPNYVVGFKINANGSLESLPGSPFVTGGIGSPGGYFASTPIAIARNSKLLFAVNKADNTITSFTMNPNTGELTAVGLPVATGGTVGLGGSLAVDDDENFLFVGNDTTSDISVFAIAANGELTPVAAPFSLGAGSGANGMTLNAVGTTLYVAMPNLNALAVLSVAADGTLSHIAGSPFAYAGGGTITSFALASSRMGVSGAYSGILASYSIDSTGAPTLLDTLDVGSNNQCVSTARNGKLAIFTGGISSGSTGVISVIQVASDGTLTPVAGSPFATSLATNGYALANPSGKYLFATERTQIEAFRMDSAGALTSINTYPLLPGFAGSVRATGLVIY